MDQIREWRIPKSRVLQVFKDNCNRKGRGSMKPAHQFTSLLNQKEGPAAQASGGGYGIHMVQ